MGGAIHILSRVQPLTTRASANVLVLGAGCGRPEAGVRECQGAAHKRRWCGAYPNACAARGRILRRGDVELEGGLRPGLQGRGRGWRCRSNDGFASPRRKRLKLICGRIRPRPADLPPACGRPATAIPPPPAAARPCLPPRNCHPLPPSAQPLTPWPLGRGRDPRTAKARRPPPPGTATAVAMPLSLPPSGQRRVGEPRFGRRRGRLCRRERRHANTGQCQRDPVDNTCDVIPTPPLRRLPDARS